MQSCQLVCIDWRTSTRTCPKSVLLRLRFIVDYVKGVFAPARILLLLGSSGSEGQIVGNLLASTLTDRGRPVQIRCGMVVVTCFVSVTTTHGSHLTNVWGAAGIGWGGDETMVDDVMMHS